MGKRFSVESIFTGIDRISKPMSRMANNVGKFQRRMSAGFNKLNRRVSAFGSNLKGVATKGVIGLGLLAATMVPMIATGAEFEQTLVNAAAKFPEGIRRGSAAFLELENTARRVGKTTEFTASQAAEGLNFLAMAGFNASQSIAALPPLVDLATASSVDLATAADIATDTLGAFGLANENAAIQAANLSRVNDVLAKVTTTANTDMETLFESIKKGGPQFKAAGASIETFGALTGTLANSSLKAAEAGTGLRNFFLRLAAPAKPAKEALQKLGIVTADASGNFRDAVDILADFEVGLKGMGTAQRSAALATIFGVRTVNSVNVLLEAGSEKLRTYRTELENSGGATKTMAATMRDTTQGAINTMKSAVEGLTITFFKLNQDGISGGIGGITDWIRSIDAFLEKNSEMVSAVGGDLFQAIIAGLKIFGMFIGLFIVLKTVMLAAQVGIFAFNATMLAFKVMMFLVAGVVAAFKLVWLAVNAAFAFSPIGAIVIGVTALIAAGVLLVKNWDTVKTFFLDTWDSIVQKVKSSVGIISTLISAVTDPFKDFGAGISNIKGRISGFFGGQSAEQQVVSPQERTARSIEETRSTSSAELTIKDETGRAELSKRRGNMKMLKLQQSGAF